MAVDSKKITQKIPRSRVLYKGQIFSYSELKTKPDVISKGSGDYVPPSSSRKNNSPPQSEYNKVRASDTTASRDYAATKQFGKSPDQPWYSSRNAQLNQSLKRTAGPSQRFPSAQDRSSNVAKAPDSSLAKPGRSAGVPKGKEISRNPYDVSRAPASKPSTASANVRKEDYKAPALKKSSTQPPAYKGQDGDKPAKRGAVTSYVKDGYTYMKNAQGNFQNFTAARTPYKPKGK